MPRKRKHLSHEEIWDDSALLDSWDAALQEYQLYHSIHARGERVEDVLEQAMDSGQVTMDLPADTGNTTSVAVNGMPQTEELEDGEVEDGQNEDDSSLLDVVQDEGLKNLMMSWYYAGYYTGLHEGQKHADAAVAHPVVNENSKP
ncbi:MAG: hypothetical protein Q9186_007092 [Xanthomendoza sp. 1 TL-2023]